MTSGIQCSRLRIPKNDFNGDLRRENFLDKESIVFDKKVS